MSVMLIHILYYLGSSLVLKIFSLPSLPKETKHVEVSLEKKLSISHGTSWRLDPNMRGMVAHGRTPVSDMQIYKA